jgi:hypothetical protein
MRCAWCGRCVQSSALFRRGLFAVDSSPKGVPAPLFRNHGTRGVHLRPRGPRLGAWRVACRERFGAETANAHVIELGAGHSLVLDRGDDVLAARLEFLG